MNNICDCSVKHAESLDITDYYEDAEYEQQMNRLEDMLLGGDVD